MDVLWSWAHNYTDVLKSLFSIIYTDSDIQQTHTVRKHLNDFIVYM